MEKNMEINTEVLESVVLDLESKISEIKNIYDSIDKKVAFINGENDIWKGKVQDKTYNYYLEIAKEFPTTIESLNNCVVFLKNAIENYKNEEKGIEKDVSINQLDIN